MKQFQLSIKECSASKIKNLVLEKNQKKSFKKDLSMEYAKNQIMYEHKLHQKHQNAIHAIFASTLF
jgi:hypothetical protein